MRRPLIIFWGYQELHNASGQIARTFWEHVSHDEFCPTILCAEIDSSFKSSNQMVSVKENGFLRLLFRGLRRLGLKDLTMIPDIEYYCWNRRVYRIAKKNISKNKYDYIHTISTPMSTHLLGLKLKEEFGLPLICQCNDPWHDNSKRKYISKCFSDLDLLYEKSIAEGADAIIQSNQVIGDIWIERYGKMVENKMHIVPFSFNIYSLPELCENDIYKKQPNKQLVISHIGSLYGNRSPLTIFKGVEKFLSAYPALRNKFVFKFIGQVQNEDIAYVKEHGLSKNVEFLGMVSPDDLQSFYLDSDVFLLIDMIIKRNGNYPSKLMMYYYYRKPIIALTTQNSNAERELQASGHTICYYDDYDSVVNILYRAITDYSSLFHFNMDEWKKHTVENVKDIYCNIVNGLIR